MFVYLSCYSNSRQTTRASGQVGHRQGRSSSGRGPVPLFSEVPAEFCVGEVASQQAARERARGIRSGAGRGTVVPRRAPARRTELCRVRAGLGVGKVEGIRADVAAVQFPHSAAAIAGEYQGPGGEHHLEP